MSRNRNIFPSKKYVCSCHFNDMSVVEFIEFNEESDRICHYCRLGDQCGGAIRLDILAAFMYDSIKSLYSTPDVVCFDYDEAEGGYTNVELLQPSEILSDHLEADYNLITDISSLFKDVQWVRKDPYLPAKHHELNDAWNNFCELVKHKIRYSFSISNEFDTYQMRLSEILTKVAEGVDSLKLINKISSGELFYRCRQHTKNEPVDSIETLGSPGLKHCLSENRMSPAGISMFYGANNKKSAKCEVINQSIIGDKQLLTMGEFELKESIILIDFTKLPTIPSIFDSNNVDRYYDILFFHFFVDDISKNIKHDNKVHIEYVPTQVLTEFFRYGISMEMIGTVDGIIYPSSQDSGDKCCVLFMDSDECKKKDEVSKI